MNFKKLFNLIFNNIFPNPIDSPCETNADHINAIPNCVTHENAVLHAESKIVNLREDPSAITLGAFTHVRGELLTFAHGGKIIFGDYCYVGEHTRIWSARKIEIGNRVLLAHDIFIVDSRTHPLDPVARHMHYKRIISVGFPDQIDGLGERPVKICDDAWIGAKSIICPGVTVGEGAVVGAGSVVTKDVDPFWVVAGNPAQKVKKVPVKTEDID